MSYWIERKYCSRCRRWLTTPNFIERTDRIGYHAFCKRCMGRTPVITTTQVGPSEIQLIEKESRTLEYPIEENRGGGKLY